MEEVRLRNRAAERRMHDSQPTGMSMNDDEQQYWFPAKRYGWGWGPPTKWQGWGVLIVWFLALFGGIAELGHGHPIIRTTFIGVMLVVLLLICYLKGEPPKWRWGK